MPSKSRRGGFTLTELLVVIGIIAVVVAILLPALAGVRSTGYMTQSIANLRQISSFMKLYEGDSRDHIVPSQFDYTDVIFTNKGTVRSETPQVGDVHEGTWTDILWAVNNVATFPEATGTLGHDYRFDSPDQPLGELVGGLDDNPFRSAARNSKTVPGVTAADLPRPFGTGGDTRGEPGFFAANDFFNARPDAPDDADGNAAPAAGRWYTIGQIRLPERSVYAIDSFAGEVIPILDGTKCPWEDDDCDGDGASDIEVDFRYSGTCLMLFLDGHVSQEGPWATLEDLREVRGIRVDNLTNR